MDKARTQQLEQMLKDYFTGYNYLSGAPEHVVRKMKDKRIIPATVVERLVSKALRAIAELEPYIEKLNIVDMQLLSEIYDSNESIKHQVESVAASRYSSPRTVYRMRLDILEKIDSHMPSALSDEERDNLFDARWMQ